MTLTIRDARPADETAWRGLWGQYVDFYRAAVPAAVTAATWSRILDPLVPVFARLAEVEGEIAGFAVGVVHARTWSVEPILYLEDLFVDSRFRSRNIGHALIEDLLDLCRKQGWGQLYWHTEGDNDRARRLYDRFAPADGYVRYRLVP